MKKTRLDALVRPINLTVLAIALIAAVLLQTWQFSDEIQNPGEDYTVAVNHYVSGTKRDMTMSLLARQLGLEQAAPLSQEEARREFSRLQNELYALTQAEVKRANDLYGQLLGPTHTIKLILLYIIVLAIALETYVRVRAAWTDFTSGKGALAETLTNDTRSLDLDSLSKKT